MNLAGIMPLANLTNNNKYNQTKWKTPSMYDPKDPRITKPKDNVALVTIPDVTFGKDFTLLHNLNTSLTNTTNTTKNATAAQTNTSTLIKEQNY
jgi:hypothetical protein